MDYTRATSMTKVLDLVRDAIVYREKSFDRVKMTENICHYFDNHGRACSRIRISVKFKKAEDLLIFKLSRPFDLKEIGLTPL